MKVKLKNKYYIPRLIFFFLSPIFLSFISLNSFAETSKTKYSFNNQDITEDIQLNPYILGEGDFINIKFFDAPELSGDFPVMNDGSLNIPLIGSVKVSGLTLNKATNLITNLLKDELIRPQIQLNIIKPRPIKVAIVGEINRPGIYSLSIDEKLLNETNPNVLVGGLPTVVDALQKAGGVTERANLRKVTLRRKIVNQNNSFKKASLDLLSLIMEGDHLQNPFLQDGDVIILEQALNEASISMKISSSNLSPSLIKVNVIGQVEKPGQYELKPNTPLIQAVLAAGGPINKKANYKNLELIRINNNGSASLKKITLNLSQGADNSKNPKLKDGDTIKVNSNILANTSDTLKVVTEPVGGLVQIWTLFRLVN